MGKPSAYLAGKCEGLGRVIDFFASNSGGFGHTVKDKRAVFLSQIDFWDWEVAELIFSVTNFNERSHSWDSCASLKECLNKLELPVVSSIINKIESDRGWKAGRIGENKIVPPTEALNEVIRKWNKLLAICEKTLFMEKKEIADLKKMGCSFVENLDKYRKVEI